MKMRDERIGIAVAGQEIEGTLIAPAAVERRAAGVLFVHGWGGNQDHYLAEARAIAALGCVCLIFNLRGHAET
jgi:dienelactone hydrolase